jgi:hypothetical protein
MFARKRRSGKHEFPGRALRSHFVEPLLAQHLRKAGPNEGVPGNRPGSQAGRHGYNIRLQTAWRMCHSFRQDGLKVERMAPKFLTTYPPLRIVIARKPR